ncbi:MAG: tetratricopeptide repeat protein [Magnetovibrio sp.]|nr:tetratricopeptide repeat protein [Magnetovibrio sp.]
MAGGDTEATLDAARNHHQAGRTEAAEAAYRAVLEDDPENTGALNGLGQVLRGLGRLDEAMTCFRQVVMIAPDHVEAQAHMAGTLADLGRHDAAVMAYGRAITLAPDIAFLHAAIGVVQRQAGDLAGAVESYLRAEHLDPDDPTPAFNRGLALEELARPDEALAAYGRAAEIDPALFEAEVNQGRLLQELERAGGAVPHYRRALEIRPDHAETWSSLGVALDADGAAAEALACYRRAIDIDPDLAVAHYNLGIALREQGDVDDAIESYRRALDLDPDDVRTHFNLGRARQDQGDEAGAADSYQAALERNGGMAEARTNLGAMLMEHGELTGAIELFRDAPDLTGSDHVNTAWNLGIALLLSGNLAEGWDWYEWRFLKNGGAPPAYDVPRWDLDADPAARVLIHAEQGYGDALQFSRYVPMVAARAAQVIFEVHPNLRKLLEGFGGAETFSVGDPIPEFDHYIPLLSLPGVFGTTIETIPRSAAYLNAEPARVAHWRGRLAGEGRAVGIAWRGNPDNPNDRRRSVDPGLLGRLLNIGGCRFFSLQKVPADGDWEILEGQGPITDLGPDLGDFAETAAVIEALDLVITVDTATAHLTGALGAPGWLMLPYVPDWRWMMDREDSPWYPSIRLFRQPEPADWPAVVERIAQELGG